jgi:hypothetical protein
VLSPRRLGIGLRTVQRRLGESTPSTR